MARPISSGRADGRAHEMAKLGLYIHIPFCSAICNYCNFNRGLFDAALKSRYVRALVAEIRHQARTSATIQRRHDFLRRRHAVAARTRRDRADSSTACRSAIDVDGRCRDHARGQSRDRHDGERLAAFRAAGINRLSFGVQSFRRRRAAAALPAAQRRSRARRVRRGAARRLRQRQPRSDDVAARAARRRLARVGRRRRSRWRPITCRCISSRSIRTRRSKRRWREPAGRRRPTTMRRRCI